MTENNRFLNMRDAAAYLGQTYRWMQRHYVDLIKSGVATYRVPLNAVKGHLMFNRESLDKYMESCQIQRGISV